VISRAVAAQQEQAGDADEVPGDDR